MKNNFLRFSGRPGSRRNIQPGLFNGKSKTAFSAPQSSPASQPNHDFPDESSNAPHAGNTGRKLGVALVGMGEYCEENLIPALEETKLCQLTGLVSGSVDKFSAWKHEYHIQDKNMYNYKNFDCIIDNTDIDIIYIVLPNALHAEYTIRAAQAGKHVICEKPMATSLGDCQAMIEACKKANRKLAIGYRLYFEPYNQEIMRLGQNEVLGPVKRIITAHGQNLQEGDWRLDQSLSGGGALMDMGIYCVQGAIYTKGQIPLSVTASYAHKTDSKKFKEIEEAMHWQFQFDDGATADCRTSYTEVFNKLRAETEQGWFELEPAYAYGDLQGKTSRGNLNFPGVNQQVLLLDHFAYCVLHNEEPTISGEMGLRDIKMVQAIYEAANSGRKVKI